MYKILVKLILIAAMAQLGLSISDVFTCQNRQCLRKLENKSREILHIDWRPISIFPEEAKRFRR